MAAVSQHPAPQMMNVVPAPVSLLEQHYTLMNLAKAKAK